jgi:hypothetical protein
MSRYGLCSLLTMHVKDSYKFWRCMQEFEKGTRLTHSVANPDCEAPND